MISEVDWRNRIATDQENHFDQSVDESESIRLARAEPHISMLISFRHTNLVFVDQVTLLPVLVLLLFHERISRKAYIQAHICMACSTAIKYSCGHCGNGLIIME